MRRVRFSKLLALGCAIGILTPFVADYAVAAPPAARKVHQPTEKENNALIKALDAPEETAGSAGESAKPSAATAPKVAPPSEKWPPVGEAGESAEEKREPGAEGFFTLDDCVELALRRNERLKGAGYEVEAAKGQLAEASAQFMPVIEYAYRAAPVPTNVDDALKTFFKGQVTLFNSIHVGLGFPIATFGQLSSARKMAKGGVEAARQNEHKARENTIYQMKQLYFGVLLAKEAIKLLDDAIGKIKSKLAEEEAKEVKEIDPYDLQQLKLFRVELERRLSEARDNLELAYEGLRVQMDLDPGAEINLDTENLRPVLASIGKEEDYIDHGMQHMPDAKLLDVGVEVKKQQYRLEKFKLLPRAGFGFFVDVGRSVGAITGLNLTDDFNNPFNYTRAGLGIEIKGTIDFHGAYGRIKKARAEYYKATYDRLIARRAIALDIRRAYLNAQRMQDDVRRAKKAESMARQMTFISKVNVDLGIGDSEKYGDALKMLLLTRGLYFKAVFDYNVALADLAQRVTLARYEELTPKPDVEEYDAFEYEEESEEGFEKFEEDATTMGGVQYEEETGR